MGDQVLSRDPATGKDEAKTVTFTIELHAPSVVGVTMRDARTGKAETLTCTPEHPLFVQGQGWVEAGSVGIGTSIVSRAGPALQVTNLTWEKNKAEELAAGTAGSSFGGYTVYNLTVEGDHAYFVGGVQGGNWVHNAYAGTPISMDEAIDQAAAHVGGEEDMKTTGRSVHNFQFRNQFRNMYTEANGDVIVKVGRLDVNSHRAMHSVMASV